MNEKCEEAINIWREEISNWSNVLSSYEYSRVCHPWSERDYQIRLESFKTITIDDEQARKLAALGFQVSEGKIFCNSCKVDLPTQAPLEGAMHLNYCPWKDRPYISLKTTWKPEISFTSSSLERARALLTSIEQVQQVISGISQ